MVVYAADGDRAPTAVVAERLPLVRVGLAASLETVGVLTVALADDFEAGVDAARLHRATLLVAGGVVPAARVAQLTPSLGRTRIVVLVAEADRQALAALFEAGADAVALRNIAPEDLGALVGRVLAGERSIDPALMSVLIDLARVATVPVGPDRSRPGATAEVTIPSAGPAGRLERRDGLERGGVDGIPLTAKERQVLARLVMGDSNAEIAGALYVSPATVKTHLAHIYAKLGVRSRHGAMSRAVSLGLVP